MVRETHFILYKQEACKPRALGVFGIGFNHLSGIGAKPVPEKRMCQPQQWASKYQLRARKETGPQ